MHINHVTLYKLFQKIIKEKLSSVVHPIENIL